MTIKFTPSRDEIHDEIDKRAKAARELKRQLKHAVDSDQWQLAINLATRLKTNQTILNHYVHLLFQLA